MSVDVTELMARIRESAARRKLELPPDGARFSLSQLHDRSKMNFALPELTLSPEFKTRRENRYHVNELLQFHDREFVRNAYRAILKREPDEAGLNSFVHHLRSGRQNKIDVLARLRFSSEGRQRNVRIDGLVFPALVRMPARIPVVGYVYEWLIGLLRIPVSIRHHRQFEAHSIAQQQQIVDHLNRVTRTVQGLEQMVEDVSALQQQLLTQRQELTTLQQALKQQHDRLTEHADNIIDLSGQTEEAKQRLSQTDRLLATHADALEQLRDGLSEQRVESAAQQARFASFVARHERSASDLEKDSAAASAYEDESLNALLLSIENRFRGERDELKQRFSFYLPYLERENIRADIVDVGCGRGEWLELLKEKGISAKGIDSNRLTVDQCRAAGLDVTHTNIREYFSELPDNSLSAISAFHVIEHLEFGDLIEFIDQSIRTLRPGGLLILETPNPENVIVSTRNFYLDPSHLRPIPSELLEFLLKRRGVTNIEIVPLHPLAAARVEGDNEIAVRFNDLFYGPMDYGVIARRP